jgi:hypothetical protein
MLRKNKLRALLLAVAAAALLFGLGALRGRDFRLNRSVRNVALRLVQIERLSQTTGVEYRLRFLPSALEIEVFDPESGGWKPFMSKGYSGKTRCLAPEGAFVFSRGFFSRFEKNGKSTRRRSVIVEFTYPGLDRKGRILFHRKGDWRVLG